MNFLHVSDLHIGKKLCSKPLLEDQKHILQEIISMAAQTDINAVLIAGDLYDKSQPSGEAVEAVNRFLTDLAMLQKPVFIISGNHDSAEQVAYCGDILSQANIHVSPVFRGVPARHVLQDAWGEVHVYLLPFLRPMQVRRAFPEKAENIKTYADAVEAVLQEIQLDPSARNVLIAHQFVIGAETTVTLTDSEERMVGGVDAIPVGLFDAFDYVALGHLHSPQCVGSERVCYAGSPLKYSESEVFQRKAALKVCLEGKNAVPQIESLPYHPLRDVKKIRGTLQELTQIQGMDLDYVFVTLTDELPPLDPAGSLLQSYPNYVQLRIENSRSGKKEEVIADRVEEKDPLEHFVDFFISQNNGQKPTEKQMRLMRRIIEEAEVKLSASR